MVIIIIIIWIIFITAYQFIEILDYVLISDECLNREKREIPKTSFLFFCKFFPFKIEQNFSLKNSVHLLVINVIYFLGQYEKNLIFKQFFNLMILNDNINL